MPNEPKSVTLSGFSDTQNSCPPHRWVLGSTTHAHIEGEGLSNVGQTDGVCKQCGISRTFEAPTPDAVHGMDSHILAEMAAALGLEEEAGYDDD